MARLSLRLALDIVFEMPTDVTIRLAARDEQKSASKIFSGKLLWFGKNIAKSCSRTPTRLNCPLKHLNAGHTYVAERDGQILGFCVVLPRPDGDADLDGLFVEPVIWRRGIGRRLVQEAERVAAPRAA